MRAVAEQIAADLASPAAIPRRNGEPVFNEPWESRVFGIAVALCDRGLYTWDEFRERLIATIAAADAHGDHSSYYARFLDALESLLTAKGICLREEIDREVAAFSARED
ncbi:MAG: nitrile hydratase accessory protein [Candidatus Binataceae bacterium]|jgi:nitrile hydratase accessory protein